MLPAKQKHEHIMLDLETFGNGANAVVVSIGAVAFDPYTDAIGEHSFHRFLDVDEQFKLGRSADASTLMWWLEQEEAARLKLIDGHEQRVSIDGALEAFGFWLSEVSEPRTVQVWGNGAAFDNAILASLYKHIGRAQPWMFWNDRCFRTLKALNSHVPKPATGGVAHDALDDAIQQSKHLQAIFNQTMKKAAAA